MNATGEDFYNVTRGGGLFNETGNVKDAVIPIDDGDDWIWDDATWIMCATFIIFTMQTGEEIHTCSCESDVAGTDLYNCLRSRRMQTCIGFPLSLLEKS